MKQVQSILLMCLFLLLFLSLKSSGDQGIGHENLNRKDHIHIKRHDSQYKMSKRSTTNSLVDIDMFEERSFPNRLYSVFVDSTVTRLRIEITSDRSPVASLEHSSVILSTPNITNGAKMPGQMTATFDVTISTGDYGEWTLRRLDPSKWYVKIQGESSLGLFCQFFLGNSQIPINGDPIQGQTYRTVLTVTGFSRVKDIKSWKIFMIESITPSSTVYPILKKGGKYEFPNLKMFEQDFKIQMQGGDIYGRKFQRVAVIRPVALILSVPTFNSSSLQKLYENTKMDIPFTVTNKLSTAHEFKIKITDTKGLAQQPTVIPATIKPGENFTGKFVLDGGHAGESTTVTILAYKYIFGNAQDNNGPSVTQTFIVKSNKTTTTSTSTSTTTTMTTTTSISKSVVTSSLLNSTQSVGSSNSTSVGTSTSPVSSYQTNRGVKSTVTNHSPGTKHLYANSQSTMASQKHDPKSSSFSSEELFGAASISGMSAGVLIGVAALVTMGLVFRKSINKKKVTPQPDENKNKLESELAWT